MLAHFSSQGRALSYPLKSTILDQWWVMDAVQDYDDVGPGPSGV
jgi:hypothetical protein